MLLVYNSLLLCFSSLLLVCIGADNLPTCQPVRYSLSICCSISSIGNLYISSVVVVLVIFHVCIRCDNNSGISITSWLNAIRRVADGESRTLYAFRLYNNWFFFCAGIYLFYLPFIYSVPKAGVCTGGAPNAPVRLQDCCKILFLLLFLFLYKSLKKNFILFCSLDL